MNTDDIFLIRYQYLQKISTLGNPFILLFHFIVAWNENDWFDVSSWTLGEMMVILHDNTLSFFRPWVILFIWCMYKWVIFLIFFYIFTHSKRNIEKENLVFLIVQRFENVTTSNVFSNFQRSIIRSQPEGTSDAKVKEIVGQKYCRYFSNFSAFIGFWKHWKMKKSLFKN